MTKSPDDPQKLIFEPKVLVLTFSGAEGLIQDDPSGVGKGVLGFRFQDDPSLQGNYEMYVQVERIGDVENVP